VQDILYVVSALKTGTGCPGRWLSHYPCIYNIPVFKRWVEVALRGRV